MSASTTSTTATTVAATLGTLAARLARALHRRPASAAELKLRRDAAELYAMSDRDLADLGISRGDIPFVLGLRD